MCSRENTLSVYDDTAKCREAAWSLLRQLERISEGGNSAEKASGECVQFWIQLDGAVNSLDTTSGAVVERVAGLLDRHKDNLALTMNIGAARKLRAKIVGLLPAAATDKTLSPAVRRLAAIGCFRDNAAALVSAGDFDRDRLASALAAERSALEPLLGTSNS